jgi:hypothetical protein
MKHTADARQIHVRVSSDLKKAVKMYCVRTNTTEQAWMQSIIASELHRKAPDLWTPATKGTAAPKGKRH